MKIVWSSAGWADVDRLHAFLAEHDLDAADAVFDKLTKAPSALLDFPRRGPRLSEFDPREVREFRVGNYLLRYEVAEAEIFILRFPRSREPALNVGADRGTGNTATVSRSVSDRWLDGTEKSSQA